MSVQRALIALALSHWASWLPLPGSSPVASTRPRLLHPALNSTATTASAVYDLYDHGPAFTTHLGYLGATVFRAHNRSSNGSAGLTPTGHDPLPSNGTSRSLSASRHADFSATEPLTANAELSSEDVDRLATLP